MRKRTLDLPGYIQRSALWFNEGKSLARKAGDMPYTLGREKKKFFKNQTFYGNELVSTTF